MTRSDPAGGPLLDGAPDGVFAFSDAAEVVYVNDALASLGNVDREAVVGAPAPEFFDAVGVPDRDRDRAVEACRDVLEAGATAESVRVELDAAPSWRHVDVRLAGPDGDADVALVGTVRDVTEAVERRRWAERQRDEHRAVARIQSHLQDVVRSAVRASTRDATRAAVCDELAASEFYDAAYLADVGDDGLGDGYAAGLERAFQEHLAARDDRPGLASLATEALDTGVPQAVTDVETDGRISETARRLCARHGYRAILSVPLTVDGAPLALLVVGTARDGAFGGRERAAFEFLGEAVAAALSAAEGRQLRLGDEATEYEIRIPEQALGVGLTASFDGTVTLDSVSVAADRRVRCHVTAEPAIPPAVIEDARSAPAVDLFGELETRGEGGHYEVVLAESPLWLLATAGASVVGGYAEDGHAYVTVRTVADRDPGQLLGLLVERYGEATVVATRRPATEPTVGSLRQWLDDNLTDRQRETLEGAYHQGYFEWPRERSAEEVAETFGVTSSTFHGHVRKATRTLLSAVFERN